VEVDEDRAVDWGRASRTLGNHMQRARNESSLDAISCVHRAVIRDAGVVSSHLNGTRVSVPLSVA
jgi:hypothetical protein